MLTVTNMSNVQSPYEIYNLTAVYRFIILGLSEHAILWKHVARLSTDLVVSLISLEDIGGTLDVQNFPTIYCPRTLAGY